VGGGGGERQCLLVSQSEEVCLEPRIDGKIWKRLVQACLLWSVVWFMNLLKSSGHFICHTSKFQDV